MDPPCCHARVTRQWSTFEVRLRVNCKTLPHVNRDERSADEGTQFFIHISSLADVGAGRGPLGHAGLQSTEPPRKLYNAIL